MSLFSDKLLAIAEMQELLVAVHQIRDDVAQNHQRLVDLAGFLQSVRLVCELALAAGQIDEIDH